MKIKVLVAADIHSDFSLLKDFSPGDVWIFPGDIIESYQDPFDFEAQRLDFVSFLNHLEKVSDKFKFAVLTNGNHFPGMDVRKYSEDAVSELLLWVKNRIEEFNSRTKGGIVYFNPGFDLVNLNFGDGKVKILCSPYQAPFGDDCWGFHWDDEVMNSCLTFEKIGIEKGDLLDVDFVVSHESPFGYNDSVPNGSGSFKNVGSRIWIDFITKNEIFPKVFMSGHIHTGVGYKWGEGVLGDILFVNAAMPYSFKPFEFVYDLEKRKVVDGDFEIFDQIRSQFK